MKNADKKKVLIIGLAAVLLVFVVYNFGDRLGGVSGSRAGGVNLFVPEAETKVFVDNRRTMVTDQKNDTVEIKDLGEGKHELIVAKDGYWPWSKQIVVDGSKRIELASFIVPMKPQAAEVAAGTEEHAKAASLLGQAKLPGPETRIKAPRERVEAWVEKDSIFAEWTVDKKDPPQFFCIDTFCSEWRKVLDSTSKITGLGFYPGREDVLLFSSGETVYAIEIDQTGTQNFQPVFEGTSPTFAPAEGSFIYVRDAGKIFKVAL